MLFADIEGFTRLSDRLPPREVVKLLNEYFTAMTAVVQRFGGILDKYIGDAMMVVWDGEIAEDAAAAVQSALVMQSELAVLQQKWLAEGKLPLKTRIGISSGKVIVGLIGSPVRRDRTVIGDAVNTASRLEALNKEYFTDIIISQSTYDLVSSQVLVKPLGIVDIKGRLERVGAYAVIGWCEEPRQ